MGEGLGLEPGILTEKMILRDKDLGDLLHLAAKLDAVAGFSDLFALFLTASHRTVLVAVGPSQSVLCAG